MLADLAEWTHARPSDLVEMRTLGYGAETRLDFDLAVRALKRWADGREQKTRMVDAPAPAKNAKPQKAVPVYRTLAEVLALEPNEAGEVARLTGLSDEATDELAEMLLNVGSFDGEDEDDE